MIVAFDPGTTTGVAVYEEDADVDSVSFHGYQFNETELYEWVDENAGSFEHVQIEKFTKTAATLRKVRVYDLPMSWHRSRTQRCDGPVSSPRVRGTLTMPLAI